MLYHKSIYLFGEDWANKKDQDDDDEVLSLYSWCDHKILEDYYRWISLELIDEPDKSRL